MVKHERPNSFLDSYLMLITFCSESIVLLLYFLLFIIERSTDFIVTSCLSDIKIYSDIQLDLGAFLKLKNVTCQPSYFIT